MFVSKKPSEIKENPFSLIGQEWMLLTAKKQDGTFNTMTASWGGVGVLWGKPVFYCFVRPGRYTHAFTEESNRITASFFSRAYRPALTLCGKKSGRDTDKIKETGLHPLQGKNGEVYFEEARLVIVGKKLYADTLKEECFCDPAPLKEYPNKDFHTVYVYEIEDVLTAE